MRYATLEKYPNYRIFEDGTVMKLDTYKTLKHTPKEFDGYYYEYVTLRNKNNKRQQVNINKIINNLFTEVF